VACCCQNPVLVHYRLYPNLSHYEAKRAQITRSGPNAVYSCQQLNNEPERNHPP